MAADGQRGCAARTSTLVHMEALDLVVTEGAQHLYASNAEHHFLTKAQVPIAPIKGAGDATIPLAVFRKIGVEQVHRNDISADAANGISPGAQMHDASLDADGGLGRHLPEVRPHLPPGRLFSLPSARVQPLSEVAAAVQEGDGDHRYAQVGGRTDSVSGKDAQATAVGRNGRLQSNLHG